MHNIKICVVWFGFQARVSSKLLTEGGKKQRELLIIFDVIQHFAQIVSDGDALILA